MTKILGFESIVYCNFTSKKILMKRDIFKKQQLYDLLCPYELLNQLS